MGLLLFVENWIQTAFQYLTFTSETKSDANWYKTFPAFCWWSDLLKTLNLLIDTLAYSGIKVRGWGRSETPEWAAKLKWCLGNVLLSETSQMHPVPWVITTAYKHAHKLQQCTSGLEALWPYLKSPKPRSHEQRCCETCGIMHVFTYESYSCGRRSLGLWPTFFSHEWRFAACQVWHVLSSMVLSKSCLKYYYTLHTQL